MTDKDRDISRRRFIAYSTAAVAGASLLTSCGPEQADPQTPTRRLTRSFNPIPKENRKQGTSSWMQSGEFDGSIEGFVDKISARVGETVTAYVSTTGATWSAEIYRMGWYGGKGARLMHAEKDLKGRLQDAPVLTRPIDNMIEAHWRPSLSIRTNRRWVSGVYLIKLKASSGGENYIPFVLRDDRPSAIFDQLPVTTWLAYNVWGGRGIYKCISGRGAGDWNARSRLVSFDRPFSQEDSGTRNGADRFFTFDYSMLRFLEREGADVTYGTSLETHSKPKLLLQHDVFLSAGHDEYWTKEMRDNLEAIRLAGVNLMFLGANTGYRAVRLESSPLGKLRRMRHYKEYTEDPLLGEDDERVAGQWRFDPPGRPENALLGIMYVASPVDDPWVCSRTDHWMFDGTGLRKGHEVDRMVGHEFDRAYFDGDYAEHTPENLEILSESPVRVLDANTNEVLSRDTAHTSLYVFEDSGAGIFAAGTIRWPWFLDDYGGSYYEATVRKRADRGVQNLTRHLLTAFGDGPLAGYMERNGHV
jgi:hypothetical protein